MLVGLLESSMIVLDDWVEQIGKDFVGLGVRGIDTNTAVQILNALEGRKIKGNVRQ